MFTRLPPKKCMLSGLHLNRVHPLLFVLMACFQSSSLQAAEVVTRLTIHQEQPGLVHVDIGKSGGSHGDILAFDAKVTTNEGINGKLSGFVMTVDIPEKEDDFFQDRIVQMVFDLGQANTIVVSGKSVYRHESEAEIASNEPQIRAIVGGTGTYIGARGQISTTRNDDGTYEHHIELID